jgi:serine/threonine protein kinase
VEITPGQRLLGRYTIVERLGFGGMGEVWRARDEELGHDVAVKALARHLVANEDARERFRLESELAGSLSHDHVVTIHDSGTERDAMVLVMELIEGGNLEARLRTPGHLPVAEALRIAREILSGLAAAHRAGLVHRDVKPANVMFTATGTVKLTDFGIARLAATETSRTAEVFGSAPYLAPERADGQPAVPASDVYAVGCVFYEMVTGMSPFTGETPAVTIARHLQYSPPAPSVVHPEITAAVDAIVLRSLAKDPAERYADAEEMLRDLEHAEIDGLVAADTVCHVRPLTLAERRRRRTDPHARFPAESPARHTAALVAVGALAAAGILAVALVALNATT